jgi:beta-glucosidase
MKSFNIVHKLRIRANRLLALILIFVLVVPGMFFTGCTSKEKTTPTTADNILDRTTVDKSKMQLGDLSADEIVKLLTLDEMAAQMIQPACYRVTPATMRTNNYGSILSKSQWMTAREWKKFCLSYQKAALESPSGIAYIYGQDDVHGVNYAANTVIFPHNIGIGAANDENLTYEMGLAVADEAKLCGMLWNFAPCVAAATEPRWGRTYESYSSNPELVSKLSCAYTKGLVKGGVVACPKHFFGDGNIQYGSGEDDRLVDRGNAVLSEQQINELLKVYKNLIDAGAQTIMISHSSLNGVKMHENGTYINKLKDEMGFQGFIVSDWESIHHITGDNLKEQVILAVNSGIDMLMEPDSYEECRQYIVEAVKEGSISQERITDAVRRIIKVKLDAGIIKDPMMENVQTNQQETGSDTYRALAEKLVEKSLVLLKNDNKTLPLKQGSKIYVCGPAADNVMSQCGGWTREWGGSDKVEGCTTLIKGLQKISTEYGLTIITDPAKASEADVTLLCVGESAYVEWEGDTKDLSLTGSFGLKSNQTAIDQAKSLKDTYSIPTVACIIAGRQVIIKDQLPQWDAAVMCYTPGTEGTGIANVLAGKALFSGKLPMPWYADISQIGTSECMFNVGYGLTY